MTKVQLASKSCLRHYVLKCKCTTMTAYHKLECGPMPNVMAAPAKYRWHPLFDAAVWLTPTTRVPCSNAAKTKPVEITWGAQTNETISAASGPKFTILWGHVGEILLLNKFFSDCRYMP